MLLPASARIPTSSMVSSTRSRSAGLGTPAFSSPNAISLSVSRLKNCDLGFWKTDPTRRAISYPSMEEASRPQIVTSPPVSSASCLGRRPLTRLVSVLFPQPLRPVRTTSSPAPTLKETSVRARAGAAA